MLESLRNSKILVVVAHPDDEVLGIGGTLNLLTSNYNCEIKVIILGEGITSRGENRDLKKFKSDLEIHNNNILIAQDFIGYNDLSTYDLPDNRFDTVPLLDIIKIVEDEINNFNPSTIFTHHWGDVNVDHRKVFEAVHTSCRPFPEQMVTSLFTFETLSGTEWIPSNDNRKFNPNFYVSLNKKNIEAKIKAMESYVFEKRKFPHPRASKSILNRAEMWGITVGVPFAEAFQLIRHLS